jgi:hypothetical protein
MNAAEPVESRAQSSRSGTFARGGEKSPALPRLPLNELWADLLTAAALLICVSFLAVAGCRLLHG